MADICPICGSNVNESNLLASSGDVLFSHYSCPRCGDYRIEDILQDDLPTLLDKDKQKIAVLSHWIRTEHESITKEPRGKQGGRKALILDSEELVESIIRNPRPSLPEQADNFIRWMGDNLKAGGEYIEVEKLAIQAIVGSVTFEEFVMVFGHLKDGKLIDHKTAVGDGDRVFARVTLSFNGWECYRELKRATTDSRKAFMAMQYGDQELDGFVEGVLKPAVKQTGFELFRLPDKPQPAGLIDDRLRVEIQTSRFLVADLTHGNAGAYWEAGYAEGLGKPVIYTCEKKVFEDPKSKPHFDTNHHLTILWDPEEPENAANKLKDTIRATLPAEAKLADE
jgi:hypothetical protein